LNLRELLKCKRVCKNWNFYATKIVHERQRVRTLLARKSDKSTWVAIADVAEVKDFFNDLDISSTFVLLFGKLPLSRPCVGGHDLFSLQYLLPTSCKIIGALSSAGVIGTDHASGRYSAFERPRLDTLSCMIFPKMDGLNIRCFHMSLEQFEREAFNPETANLEESFGIPAADRVKCLILICPSYVPFDMTRAVFSAFWLRERGRVALCGGSVEDVIELEPGDREIRERGLVGIAFCGDDRVSAGSFVISPTARTKPKVQNLLRQFPPIRTPSGKKGTRFGFAFTCCGRGSRMFKTASQEVELIQAQFPDTPIAGVFSMGECGVTCWPPPNSGRQANSTESEELTLDRLPDVLLSFTTVVAIVNVDH